MKEDRILVSVIMPVFNGAEYLEKSIGSVVEQTYKDLELLLVNDGSADDSEKVILGIMSKNEDSRIRYIEQDNAGIAKARNTGLKNAIGDFIFFIDQDDWLDSTCIENLVKEAQRTGADEVIGGFKLVSPEGKWEEVWELDPNCEWSKFRIVAPWGKLYRKALLDQYHICFFHTKISEDLYFNILFAGHTDKIVVIPKAEYNWLHNNKSESRMKWNKMTEDRNPIVMLDELQNRIADSPYLKKDIMTYYFTKYLIWYLLYSARGSDDDLRRQTYGECFGWLRRHYPDFMKWKVTGIHKPKGEQLKNRIFVTGCVLLYRIKLLPVVLGLYSRC